MGLPYAADYEIIPYRAGEILSANRRVIVKYSASATELFHAEADEPENGLCVEAFAYTGVCHMVPMVHGSTVPIVTADDLTAGSTVYRAADGKVGATGTFVIGRAEFDANADEIAYVIYEPYGPNVEGLADRLDITDGMSFQKADLNVVDSTGLKLDVEAVGGGNIEYVINKKVLTLDCTSGSGAGGAARVALTAGTDENNPATNYIYTIESAGEAILQASATMPTGAFAWVGKVIVPDATTWATTNEYGFQRFTESFLNDSRGALSHAREKLRALGAVYISGCTTTTTITTVPAAPDTVHVEVAAGQIYQLHRQSWPATTTGPYYWGNGTDIYEKMTDLSEALQQADGTAITNNQRFNLVIWGAANLDSATCKVFANAPTGVYNTDSAAQADNNNTGDYTVPDDMRSVAFMIARVALKYTTANGGTWSELGTYSLLGTPPGVRAGGAGAVAANEFDDSQFRVFDNGDSTKQIALEASSITTATTRTITMADADVDLDDHVNMVASIENVLNHGAVGDGVTDDTTAVQAALTAGGTVFIPAGYTFATTGLTLSADDTTVKGGGTLKCTATTGSHLTVSGDGCRIMGLEFDGNSGGARTGINVTASTVNVTIQDCIIRNYESSGGVSQAIFVGNLADGTKILNNTITDISTTDSSAVRGIRMSGATNVERVLISGNSIDYIYPVADAIGFVMQSFASRSTVTVTNNVFTRCATQGIAAQTAGCVISNNIVEMTNVGGGADPTLAIAGEKSHTSIIGNTILATVTDQAIKIGSVGTLTDVCVSSNIVEMVSAGANADGIYINRGLTNGVISANSFRGGMRYGVRCGDPITQLSITGNVFDNMSNYGIVFEDDVCDSVSITGNVFSTLTGSSFPIYYSGATAPSDIRIAGNSYDGSGGKYLAHSSIAAGDPTYVHYGTGTPESNWNGIVGHRFVRTDGGTSTVLYVKESGTGNTGWIAK